MCSITSVCTLSRCKRIRGLRVDPRAQGPGITVRMTDANKQSANVLPLFPRESPRASEVKDWWLGVKTTMAADQFALFLEGRNAELAPRLHRLNHPTSAGR